MPAPGPGDLVGVCTLLPSRVAVNSYSYPSAGAPTANATFVCSPSSNPADQLCYVYTTAELTQAQARSRCQRLGGDLAMFTSTGQQQLAENYFR